VLVGAEVPGFGSRSTLVQGEKYLVAETCEYRRHFLNFRPRRIVITNIEPDHLDYFRGLPDMLKAFEEYGLNLARGGTLISCADDEGARAAAGRIQARRPDLVLIAYGRTAEGPFRIAREEQETGRTRFWLAGSSCALQLKVPGGHNVLNAAGALALCLQLWQAERPGQEPDWQGAARALLTFAGSRRRSEIVGEAGGVLFMDDYAHHPTAIEKTLEGIRRFYPDRRIVVDFMSHTYSRTHALLPEFGRCFGSADSVVLHRIYASARETDEHGITGQDLYREVSRNHPRVSYFEDPAEAVAPLAAELKPGDLFITMGAGDNWKVGRELLRLRGGRT
jgi:UDP-N-acetylmuramate--alanine ligase